LFADTPEVKVIAELVHTLHRLGIHGIWVFIDGLESWIDADTDQLGEMLRALLTTLTLFEEPGFVLKLMIPTDIKPAIVNSGGIVRRRLEIYQLEWSSDKLIALLERRLAVVCQRDTCTLSDVCEDESLIDWLDYYGGQFPRGWLELVRTLVETYVARGAKQPLTRAEWLDIQHRHPPRLWLDMATNRVFLGHGEIADIQPGIYKILSYLYEQRPRLCTRSELFYKAYRGLSYEPNTHDDPGWESTKDWGSVIDTLLWRLRKTLEPDPRHPRYIISKRGQGVRLDNVW
jgi:DNA-binding winged helix-turn-helix (wHTH) protein